ncbi:hypothetical protein ACFL6H_00115 [Candidatus Latescibacterota bacterium]
MIKDIMIREIQDHLFKLRFILLGTVLVLLFVFASLAFISDFRVKTENYETPLQLLTPELTDRFSPDEKVTLNMFVQHQVTVNRLPQAMWFFCERQQRCFTKLFFGRYSK